MISIKKAGMKFIIIFTLILLANSNLFADFVYTINEGRIKGTVIEELDDTIKFRTMDNEEIYIYKDKINKIIYCKTSYLKESYNEFGVTIFHPELNILNYHSRWFNLSYSRWFKFFGIRLTGFYYYDYAIDLEFNFKINDFYHFMHGFGTSIGYRDFSNIRFIRDFKGLGYYIHYFMNVKHIFMQIGIGLIYGDRIYYHYSSRTIRTSRGITLFSLKLALGFNYRFLKNVKRVNYKKERYKKKQFKYERVYRKKRIWKKRIK